MKTLIAGTVLALTTAIELESTIELGAAYYESMMEADWEYDGNGHTTWPVGSECGKYWAGFEMGGVHREYIDGQFQDCMSNVSRNCWFCDKAFVTAGKMDLPVCSHPYHRDCGGGTAWHGYDSMAGYEDTCPCHHKEKNG